MFMQLTDRLDLGMFGNAAGGSGGLVTYQVR